MPHKHFEKLRRFLHVVDNNTYDAASNDKLFDVEPVLIIIEPEENHSINEQIIPSRTKYSKVHQYNLKKLGKVGIQKPCQSWIVQIHVQLHVYAGKDGTYQQRGNDYNHLQKSA